MNNEAHLGGEASNDNIDAGLVSFCVSLCGGDASSKALKKQVDEITS